MKLLEVAADGPVLLGQEVSDRRVDAMVAGATAPVDVSLPASSTSQWISAGGSMFMLSDQATAKYSSYLQKLAARRCRLAMDRRTAVSPDGRWVIA
jgi:hypothetical protein